MRQIVDSAEKIKEFQDGSLTSTISALERQFSGKSKAHLNQMLESNKVDLDLLLAALDFKKLAGQINVLIHAVGILLLLPKILEEDEIVESMSIGAGNTGRPFDLETNKMVAEFKFIQWRGGAEVIRQNAFFKDFFLLGEHKTEKKKRIYVTHADYPIRFMNSKRSMASVMSRHVELWRRFQETYPTCNCMYQYYDVKCGDVEIKEVLEYIPEFRTDLVD